MATYRTRNSLLYISTAPEGTFNTPVTAGANFKRVVTDNPLVKIIGVEKRNDLGRSGSEFATAQCNGYFENAAINISGDVDFDAMSRLALRAVGGAITDATVVALAAFSHTAPMLASSSGLQLPSSTIISVIEGSSASFLYAGCVVDQFTLSQDGVSIAKVNVNLIGSGKHRKPHAVTSLPAAASFACTKPFAYLSYDNGSPVDLGAGCTIRAWTVSINNNHAPVDDRCTGDSSHNAGDYTASGGASDASFNSKLLHGDRTVTGSFTIELDTIAQWTDMMANTAITSLVFGVRGAVLDGTGPTYESLKITIPTSFFQTADAVDSNGKAALTVTFLPTTTGTSIATVAVVNGTSGTFS
jgi:hypothetical protein